MRKIFTTLIEKITHLFTKKYSYSKLILFFIVIGIIVNLPYTVGRFSSDDFMFVSIIEENIPYNTLTGFWSLGQILTEWDTEGLTIKPGDGVMF